LKIVQTETLISVGAFATSSKWQEIRKNLHESITRMDHPAGSGEFLLFPESGKRRGEGNGVTPIKNGLMYDLKNQGWLLEEPLNITAVDRPGKLDAVLPTDFGAVALEWETGNISSSHRALNKMALGLLKNVLAVGILVVPSADFAQYLTDRVGNYPELVPYMDLWRAIPCSEGVLEVIVVEHDRTSLDVLRIPKGTSGRALQ
jgi:hypothetical protein